MELARGTKYSVFSIWFLSKLVNKLWKKIPGRPFYKKSVGLVVILSILIGLLVPLWNTPIPPPSAFKTPQELDYHQQKVGDGAYVLKDREPVREILAKPAKVDVNLQENKAAVQLANGGKEAYRWQVKLPSGTIFSFGLQTTKGIFPYVKVVNKDNYFVRYIPEGLEDTIVKPQVKENVISWQIAPGITARYTMQQDRVKADYIVESAQAIGDGKLDFVVEHNAEKDFSLNPELMPKGDIAWIMENGMEAFTFPAPVVYDANKKSLLNTKYLLQNSEAKGRSNLSIVLPQEKLTVAVFPLIIDPVVIDSTGVTAAATGYGNARRMLRDAYGNLFAIFYGGAAQELHYKNYNSNTWTAGAAIGGLNYTVHAADIDAIGDIHVASSNTSNGDIKYIKVTITRDSSNLVTNVSNSSTLTLDSSGLASRPSLIVANKGSGAGKEKIVIAWAMNTTSGGTRIGEIRVMQCDVADNCGAGGGANWWNVSEQQGGSASACAGASTTTGLPSADDCPGAADTLWQTSAHELHHAVLTQIPGRQKRSPAAAKFFDNTGSVWTDLTNALDENNTTDTGTALNSWNPTNDFVYIGDTRKFSKVTVDIQNNQSVTADLTLKYCSANSDIATACDTWTTASNFVDNTDNNQWFAEDGSLLFDEPSNWVQSTENGSQQYWIQLSNNSGIIDTAVSVDDFYINDRNAGSLMIVGGSSVNQDLRAAYVPWDEISGSAWENNPADVGNNPWRTDVGAASSALADQGAEWDTWSNFPLSATIDYINNRTYISYVEGTDTASGITTIKSVPNNRDVTAAANWTTAAFPATTEATDNVNTITSDGQNIYIFYVLDPGTNSLVWQRCSPQNAGLGTLCDHASDWGSVNTLDSGTDGTHPQAVVTKAFGDTVAIDVVYTTTTIPNVEYSRTYYDLADRTVATSANSDTGTHRECSSGTHDMAVASTFMDLGHRTADAQCAGSVASESHVGFRFPNIIVPQGSAISSAYVDFLITGGGGSVLHFDVFGEDTDNSSSYTTSTDCTAPCSGAVGERTPTTSVTSYAINFAQTVYRIDVTDQVQEIICRGASAAQPCVGDFNSAGSWASGNALSILLISTEGGGVNNFAQIVPVNAGDAVILKPTLQINMSEASKSYSVGTATQIATGSGSFTGLDHPLSSVEIDTVDTDDDLYASVAATMNYASSSAQPTFMFKVNNTNNNNTYKFDAVAKVKSTVRPSAKPVYLQVYRGGSTNNWVTVAQDTSTAGDTEFSLDPGEINSSVSDYYFAESPGLTCTSSSANCWTYWRIYQDAPGSLQNEVLSVDYFNVTYSANGADTIVFTNPTRTFKSNACNGVANVFTMELQQGGVAANPSQSTVVRVSSDSTGETIYSDSACTTVVANGDFTFTTSENSKSVYMVDTGVEGSYTLTGTRQSGDTLTSGTSSYSTYDLSSKVQGGVKLRGGTTLR